MEPRLLLSADTQFAGITASLTTGLDAVGAEIRELLDQNALFNTYVPGIVEPRTVGDDTREVSPTFGEAMSISTDVAASDAASIYQFDPTSATLASRYAYVAQLAGSGLGAAYLVYGDAAGDEAALRAMDIDADGQVAVDEAFQVLVVGRLQNYLSQPLLFIADQNGVDGVNSVDLGLQVADFLDSSLPLAVTLNLSDRLALTVNSVSSSLKNDALAWDADISVGLIQRDRFDLGYQADKLGILPDPGAPPNPNNDPFKVPVVSSMSFGSLVFGFTGAGDGVFDDGNSEFFFAAPDRPSDPTDGIRAGVSIGSPGDPFETIKGGSFIGINVGFLGAHVYDPDGADPADSGVMLDMDVVGAAVDPSNVSALGFTAAQQGVPAPGGSVEAQGDRDATAIATHAIQFTLKIGNDALHPETELTLPAAAYADTAAIVAALNTALGGSALAGLVNAGDGDTDDDIAFTLVASDATPLGFANEQRSAGPGGQITAGAASGLIGVGQSPTSVSFLLSANHVVKLVTVSVTVDADGADNLSGTPAEQADDNQITAASLRADLQAALDAAFGGGVATAALTGSNLRISAAGAVEISRTLTLDTLERITLAELQAPGQSFDIDYDSGAKFEVDLALRADEGLQKADDSAYRPEGTIKVDIDPFAPNAVKGFVVDTIPGTTQQVVRADYLLTDAAGVPLKGGPTPSDLQDLLDFNVISVADILGSLNEIGTWFERLSGTELLQGLDLPFADANLGDLLNFKDLVTDAFLIDDLDNGVKAGTDDVAKLLKWVQISGRDKLVAMFGTAQQLETRLNTILGMNVNGRVFDDADGRQNLTYEVAVADVTLDVDPQTPETQPLFVPLDFELNLDPLANFETSGKLQIEAEGNLGFTFGVILGDAVDALKLDVALDSTPLADLNSEAGITLNTNRALTTVGEVRPLVGRLSGDATFKLTLIDGGVAGEHTVVLHKSTTDNNKTLADLVGDLNLALTVAGLGGKIEAIAEPIQGDTVSARIVLQIAAAAAASITRFNTEVSTNNRAYTELGLRTQAASTVSLLANTAPTGNNPGGTSFTIEVKRSGVPAVSTTVNLTAGDTADNVSLQSLVDDLNASLLWGTGIVASQSVGRIAFSAVDRAIDAFSVAPVDTKLGFDLAATTVALQAAGVTTLPTALVGGVQWRGGAGPGDPFGRLAADVEFTIDIGEGAKTVTVAAASAATNTSTDDLIKSVNGAIEAEADLKGKIAALNDNGRIALRAIAISVGSITVAGLSGTESTALGIANGSTIGALGVTTAGLAPVSYGVSEDVAFTVTINGTAYNATLTRDNTILNRSLYDLAASLNNAINAAVGGFAKNPLVANVQSGRIVIGLKTDGGSSTNLVGDPATTTAPGGIAASTVTSFSVNSANPLFASELKLVSAAGTPNVADGADFVIVFRDGSSARIALDALDTNVDQKLDRTLFELKNAIVDQAKRPDTTDRIAVDVNTDGTSLRLTDLTGGTDLFRVIAVNGSPAAAQLGILGSDTSNLNLGEVPLGAPAADGVIDGGKLATIELRDRIYLKDVGASAELAVKAKDTISAEATFGFAGIKVSSSANQEFFTATAELPLLANQVSLRDLFDKLGDGAALKALLNGSGPTLSLTADFELSVSTEPDASPLIQGAGSAKVGFITSTNGDDTADAITLTLDNMLPAGGQLFPDLGFKIVPIDFGDLLKFKDIQFDNVIDALQAIAEFLKQFETFQFLDDDIPVLGVSVSDLISLADDFQAAVNDFRDNPAGGIQSLAQKIQEALGLPNFANGAARDAFFSGLGIDPTTLPAGLDQLIEFVIDGNVLRFDLRLPVGFSRGLSVDLDVGEALGVSLGPVELQGGANLAASGYLDAKLSFGIDLTDPTKLLIYDADSGITGKLHAGAQNVQFNAAIGPLGVFVKDGAVNLDLGVGLTVGDGNAAPEVIDLTNPATLTAFLGTLAPTVTGSVDATLPVYFPSASAYLDDITFTAGFALAGTALDVTSPSLTVPDLSGIDLSSLNPFDSIPQMLDALDFFLSGLQAILDGEVFSIELPLVGDQLRGAADFIDDLRRDVLGPIRTYAEQAPDLGLELVQKLLYSLLGPGSAGVTVPSLLNPSVQQPLFQFLGLPGNFSGLNLLKDYDNSDGETLITFDDIASSNAGNEFQWLFRLGQSFTPSVDVAFDLGVPALALDMDVGLDITIDWDLALGLGIGPSEGAYIFIGDHRGNDALGDDELLLTLEVDLAETSSILGSLGFLQLEINESTTADPKLENSGPGAGKRNTFIAAQFGVDLINGSDTLDTKLSFSELGNLGVQLTVEAEAEVNLDLVARFNPDIIPDAVSALLPEVSARFVLDWETGNLTSGDVDFASSLKLLGFRDVEVNMGSFISDFLGPFVEKVAEVTGPLQPIIDVITEPIPVISDLAGQPISLVDIAGMTGYVEPAMIYAIADIITLVNKIGDASEYGDFAIPLGDFLLLDAGGSGPLDGATLMQAGYSLKGDTQFDADSLKLNYAVPSLGGAGGLLGSTAAGSASEQKTKDLISGLDSGTEAGSSGFDFPLFKDPSLIFGLLMGKDIPLITYDLAPFGMDFSYVQKFPVWDALFVRIGGSVGLSIDLAFGYDTAGVRQFAEGGFSNPLDLLGGLYVSDTNQPSGEGTDVPELILKGELFAGAELNLGIASAGAEGAIGLVVNFDLYDPDSDGKVRVDELLGNFLYEFNYGSPALAPLAIFDVTGEVYAQLRAFVEALFFKYTFEITPKITLVEFTVPFEREPFLATERGDGSLLLNIGPNAAQRLNGDTRDLDEEIHVASIADDPNHVLVWGMGLDRGGAQKYKVDPTKGIFAYGGSGNDIIDLSEVIHHNIVYTLDGGVGDDVIAGSSGGGTMKGDIGNDSLTGGDGVDIVFGGEGNDAIDGGKGGDFLFGDSGIISVLKDESDVVIGDRLRSFVGAKDGDDHILGGDGADIVFGGGGNDRIEAGASNDIVLGDGGNFDRVGGNLLRLADVGLGQRLDVNARGAGGKDVILGNAGNDKLFGGSGDDLIDGGADDDEIEAGAGFDTAYGGSGADLIYGDADADVIFGFRDPQGLFFGQPGDVADAGADGIDTVYGEAGNDFIRGNGAGDLLQGGAGADILFGDAGDDQLFGEADSDILFGGADDDFVDGSDGADIAFGDDGLVAWFDFSTATINPLFDFMGSRIRYLDSGGGLTDQLIGDGAATLLGTYASSADALATSLDLIVTATLASDGNDTVVGGDGKDILFGGGSDGDGLSAGQDILFGDFDPSVAFKGPRPNGQDILIGDGGRIEWFGRRIARAASESGAEDGRDTMSGNDAGDFMFGGGFSDVMHGFQTGNGNQPLDGVADNDVMLGDHGEILFNESEIANRIEIVRTTAVAGDSGRSDTMYGTFGNDVMFGGLNGSSDVIEGGLGQDIAIGDQGEIRFDLDGNLDTLDLIRSYRDGLGGADIVSGGEDADVLIGGTAGDTMYGDNAGATSGAADGEDIMLGDNADIWLLGTVGRLTVKVAAMPVGSAVDLIATTDDGDLFGGADTMSGNAKADIVIGGINAGGIDVLYGDAAAPVNALDGDDVLIGDNGLLDFTFGTDADRNTVDLVRSLRDGLGGTDHISGNAGADLGIGGTAGDLIFGDNATASGGATDGGDVLLGDNADILTGGPLDGPFRLRVLGTAISLIKTTDTAEATGGVDTIEANAGADVVAGGVAGDVLFGDAATPVNALDGNDVLLGDNGELAFGQDLTLALAATTANLTTLDRIRSYLDALGGADTVSGNAGADTALGGTAGDMIYGDNATATGADTDLADILLGDNGELLFVNPAFDGTNNGGDRIVILGGAVASIRTSLDTLATGGVDTVSGNAGGDILLGGVYGDLLYGDRAVVTTASNANDGNDILLGDNGALEWLSTGRLDEITGIDVAAENPDLAAGFALRDANLDTLDLVTTEQPHSGGRDLVFGDNGRDAIFGGTDADRLHGDSGDADAFASTNGRDLIFGDHGRLYPQFPRTKNGEVLVASPGIHARNFFAIDIGRLAGGEGDEIWGEEGDDILLGQQGDDRMWGGSGNDDMMGGHNVAGGWDELGVPAAGLPAVDANLLGEPGNPFNVAMNDAMDGGSGNDTMTGDNAVVWRRADDLAPRFRLVDDGDAATTSDAMYTTTGSTIQANVGSSWQSDPDDAAGRDIRLLDHDDAVEATPNGRYGNDVMAGGADADVMFGQLGTDLMQGDGQIGPDDGVAVFITRRIDFTDTAAAPPAPFNSTGSLYFNIPEAATDGDDYMEGNGGGDLMYGNLGQDDMIGGSSALFGLTSNFMRPDGSDTMFGGAGVRIVRNDLGMALGNGTATDGSSSIVVVGGGGHARDADFMMGDNANVFRLVAPAGDVFRTFNYDDYAGGLRIVPRAMQQLDYTFGGSDYAGGSYSLLGQAQPGGIADNGAADLMHGEAGDDILFGMAGSDVMFGEGQDDDLIGGYGHDWMSGGTGQDGLLGDDGLILTSRNSIVGEPLYGIAGLLPNGQDNTKYSNGNALDEAISTPGSIQTAVINKSGELKKTADLVPFSYDPAWMARDDEFPDNADGTPFADDILFGGWGSDWLHGGSGDDAISGAEALAAAYVPTYDPVTGLPTGLLNLGYAAVGIANALVINPTTQNPGHVLFFHPEDLDGAHLNNRFRAGEFELYDEYSPRAKILLDTTTGKAVLTGYGPGIVDFLLNFDKTEAVQRPGGTVPKATGQQTESYGPVADDGADAIFGDLGNDWIVGGTGRDNLYGGWGNDLLQADDNLDTDTVPSGPQAGPNLPFDNEGPDTHPTYEDRAYGGAGRDVIIGNTGGDRLIDWVGEYNSYIVPYAPFGQASVSRTLQPFLPEFLYALSAGDGADPTRYVDAIGSVIPQPTSNNPNPSRNGEPHGELGLVLQKDFAWGDQTGAPADPQAGNIPGGPRDVLRSASFTGNNADAFVAAAGAWKVANNVYEVAPAAGTGTTDAISLFNADVAVPSYFEITATINAVKPIAGFKANAYIVFDYFGPDDFKFAGINASTNKIEIGQRAAWGFQVLAWTNMTLKAGTDYNVLVAINGSAVTLVVNNALSISHAFAPRLDHDGVTTYGINAGMFGLGADNGKARIDNVVVQRIPPKVTLTLSDVFDAAPSLVTPAAAGWTQANGRLTGAPASGAPYTLATNDIAVASSALLKLDATLATTGVGGIVFDLYSPTDFKWAAVSKATGQVLLGHHTARGGWVVDASVLRTIPAGDSVLSLTLRGTTVNVSLNGQSVLSRIYNGNVVDGGVGLFSRTGSTSFDSFTLQTDDAKFGSAQSPASPLMAAAPAGAQSADTAPLLPAQLDLLAGAAAARWLSANGGADMTALDGLQVSLADLPGLTLASYLDGRILVDIDAAGHGWFVDRTPADDREFRPAGELLIARPRGDAVGRMDLLSVLVHEMGHALGMDHDDGRAMSAQLAVGARITPMLAATVHTAPGPQQPGRGAPAWAIDWGIPAVTPERARHASAPAESPARGGGEAASDWRHRFVNDLGRAADRPDPNASLRVVVPVSASARVDLRSRLSLL